MKIERMKEMIIMATETCVTERWEEEETILNYLLSQWEQYNDGQKEAAYNTMKHLMRIASFELLHKTKKVIE